MADAGGRTGSAGVGGEEGLGTWGIPELVLVGVFRKSSLKERREKMRVAGRSDIPRIWVGAECRRNMRMMECRLKWGVCGVEPRANMQAESRQNNGGGAKLR